MEAFNVPLRDPLLAAFLAWLIPGCGHLYQGRTAKGILFMTCILGTFFFGLYLGRGHVVYASMRPAILDQTETIPADRRLPYFCQIGVGLPALPALVQTFRTRGQHPKQALWSGFMAPPRRRGQVVSTSNGLVENHVDQLDMWHHELHSYFELGTVYTMIAGLLNVLVIYDAWGGPLWIATHRGQRKERK